VEVLDRLAASAPVDLILSDIYMPRMNGFDLVERLRAIPPLASAGPGAEQQHRHEFPAAIRRRGGDVTYLRKG
jgi:CheY-like chemotaxis protein